MAKEKGYTLKLSIYVLTIKRKFRNPEEKTFKDVLSDITGETDKEQMFSTFIRLFLNSFENKFKLNSEGTKAIAIKQINSNPTYNEIDGIAIGGLTGIEQEVYKTDSSKNKEKTITNDEVASLPYYFKLWLPFDSNTGVLMVQSYTEAGVVSLIEQKISSFFSGHQYSLASTKFIPEDYKEQFKKRSVIDKLILTKTQLSKSARGALNGLFSEFEGLKVEIKISGFKVSVDDFWKQFDQKNPLNANLSEFEMNNPNDYKIIATYKDESGHQSQAKMEQNLDITPTIFLPDELKENGSQYPNYKKIQKHTDAILEQVKTEIGYKPHEVE